MEQINIPQLPITCPSCQSKVEQSWFFCPFCGTPLQEKPLSTSLGRQLFMYLISFFFAPLGLGWGIKYVKQKGAEQKMVGYMIIFLTILAICLLIFTVKLTMDKYSNILNNLNKTSPQNLNLGL